MSYPYNDFKYYTYNRLLIHVGDQLVFEAFDGIKIGVLKKDPNREKLWLDFCGQVDATTVKILALPLTAAEIAELAHTPKIYFTKFKNQDQNAIR